MSTINVKDFFLKRFCGYMPEIYPSVRENIICAELDLSSYGENDEEIRIEVLLKVGFNDEDFLIFLDKLDKNIYEFSLSGTVWLNNGEWFTYHQGDLDYSYWIHHKLPEIPKYLL